jgi:ankyrin repeat protein
VNAQDSRGWTPLSRVAQEGHAPVVEYLLSVKGVNAWQADLKSWGPLAWAVHKGHAEVIQLLAVEGVQVNQTDSKRMIMHASRAGHTKAVKLFEFSLR